MFLGGSALSTTKYSCKVITLCLLKVVLKAFPGEGEACQITEMSETQVIALNSPVGIDGHGAQGSGLILGDFNGLDPLSVTRRAQAAGNHSAGSPGRTPLEVSQMGCLLLIPLVILVTIGSDFVCSEMFLTRFLYLYLLTNLVGSVLLPVSLLYTGRYFRGRH